PYVPVSFDDLFKRARSLRPHSDRCAVLFHNHWGLWNLVRDRGFGARCGCCSGNFQPHSRRRRYTVILNPSTLARVQFAFTVSFHIIFPTMSIGLAMFLAVVEGLWLKTKEAVYLQI